MLGNSISIKNSDWNPVVLKKIAKTSKNYHFSAQLVKKWGPHGPHPKTIFFSEITKPDHTLSKLFYFNKCSDVQISDVLAELFFYFV